MSATVMITTGGTGGHVFPGLAVASRLIAKGCEVFWLGTRDGIEARLVPQHGVDFEAIRFGGVRGKGLKRLLLGPFSLLLAFYVGVDLNLQNFEYRTPLQTTERPSRCTSSMCFSAFSFG